MANRLEMAEQFVREQLEKRDDIIGAIVCGSVATGEYIEGSDIDIILVTKDTSEPTRSICVWRDGIFFDAQLKPIRIYSDFEAVMTDAQEATHIKDSVILYDRTGTLTTLRKRVRSDFMKSEWLGRRMQNWLDKGREYYTGLRKAVQKNDLVDVCRNMAGLNWKLCSVPLLRAGMTPGSTKILVMLRMVSPKLTELYFRLEGSAQMEQSDVLALVSIVGKVHELSKDPSEWTLLSQHLREKWTIMVKKSLHREALHGMWFWWLVVTDEKKIEGLKLASKWLHKLGWEGEAVLKEKVRLAKLILEETETLAADLPVTDATQ